MTRSRKSTLSVKEFSHLVSEALDIANAPPVPPSLVEHTTLVSEHPKHRSQPSSFQRIFARPTPSSPQRADPPHAAPEDLSDTPRKMIAWPFSRSPRKRRSTTKDNATPVHDPAAHHALSPYALTSPATTSTSSLGSLVPAHERLFQIASSTSDEPGQSSRLFSAGAVPSAVAPLPSTGDPPTDPGNHAAPGSLHADFGNASVSSIPPPSDTSNQTRASFEGTEASHSIATSERDSFDDPTPRASSFPSRMTSHRSLAARRRRSQPLSLVVPPRSIDVLALRPAVGAAPHPPSETESSVSVCMSSPTSPTFPVAGAASPTFPTPGTSLRVLPTPPPSTQRISSVLPDVASSPPHVETVSIFGFSPRQRKRAISRSLTPPPLPRPPPTGPLPAVPCSVPPVPPLPPLLTKLSTNMPLTSPPRPTASGVALTNPNTTALPPSPPGGLRLPSRLSWVNGVRAALPSPPASPTKSLKSLAGKSAHPVPSSSSPSKPDKGRSNALKRPKSIGVIEAADGAHVRRTKSILLLGSKSKSNVSLGAAVPTATTKRVQIRAEVDLGGAPSHKPRCQSSAPALGRFASAAAAASGGVMTSAPAPTLPDSELLVLRERRHSAPMLSRMNRDAPVPMAMLGASEDWTLSLPFCTDVPGHKILPSPTLTPVEQTHGPLVSEQEEDWTLCMPLKPRASTPTTTTEGRDSECTLAETTETTQTQLPTPSPSPTQFTQTPAARALDPEEGVPLPLSEEEAGEAWERPMSPASLGPHVGGLDLAGGRGKRASGWHVYGWFDEVSSVAPVTERAVVAASVPAPVSVPDPVPARVSVPVRVSFPVSTILPDRKKKYIKSHVMAFRKAYYDVVNGRHPSQDSTSSDETIFYSARSSLLVS